MSKWAFDSLAGKLRNHPIVAFDVEGTGDDDGFIMGCVYDKGGPTVYHDRETMKQYLLRKKYRNHIIYAHNAEYDVGALFQPLSPGWSIYKARSRFIKATYSDGHKHTWTIQDTCNLTNFRSLAAIGEIVKLPKYSTPDYLKARSGSHVTRSSLSVSRLSEIETYVVRDARIVYEFGEFVQSTLNVIGGNVRVTAASTAMDTFRRSFLDTTYWTPSPCMNNLCREAYYGARTEAFILNHVEGVYGDDVHSMYPSVMSSTLFPDPSKMVLVEKYCKPEYIHEKEGITHCTVCCPDLVIPLLPTRIEGHLIFPTGTFSGAWCHNELRRAIELGYEIDGIDWQIIARDTCSPFKRYVETLYALKEAAYQEANPTFFMYKLLLNSLYGKFAQRSEGDYVRFKRLENVPDLTTKGGYEVVEWQGSFYVLEPVGGRGQPCFTIVIWPAYITAAARLRVYDRLLAQGKEAVYCDTDSVVGRKNLPIGPGLGSWGRLFGPTTIEIRGEKYYRYLSEKGLWDYKKAGVKVDKQAQFWEEGKVSWERPRKLAEAVRDDLPMSTWVEQPKTDKPRYYKRCPLAKEWIEGQSVATRPWTYQEAVAYLSYAPKVLPYRDRDAADPEVRKEFELATIHDWIEKRNEEIERTGYYSQISLRCWELQTEIDVLRESCIIPVKVMLALWDYAHKRPRRVTVKGGKLTTWEYGKVDDIATELGFRTDEDLVNAMRKQADMYERIKELEKKLKEPLEVRKE